MGIKLICKSFDLKTKILILSYTVYLIFIWINRMTLLLSTGWVFISRDLRKWMNANNFFAYRLCSIGNVLLFENDWLHILIRIMPSVESGFCRIQSIILVLIRPFLIHITHQFIINHFFHSFTPCLKYIFVKNPKLPDLSTLTVSAWQHLQSHNCYLNFICSSIFFSLLFCVIFNHNLHCNGKIWSLVTRLVFGLDL